MKQIYPIITLSILFVAGLTSLSSCAYSLTDCSKYAGTNEYTECLAFQGNQQMQYELDLAAYEEGDTKKAIKWLKMAAEPKVERLPEFIPSGSNGDVTIRMYESGLKTPGHPSAQLLLTKMYEKGLGVKVNNKQAERYRKMSGN